MGLCPNCCQLQCFASAILSAIVEFVIEFASNFYGWCGLSLHTIQWKNEVSTLINGRAIANYSVSSPAFCLPSWNLKPDLCQTSTADVCCHWTQFREKNEVSILINARATVNYSVSRPPFCQPSWNLWPDLCQTSTDNVCCHCTQFSEQKKSLY